MRNKRQKVRGKLQKLRADKTGSINNHQFNFLEKLLIFRTLENLSVPPESSVKFSISREEMGEGICLLIHIDDDPNNSLFRAQEVRPDYLAIYFHGNGCICTIIEMKSKGGKDLKHGLEQIKMLADRLKQEFQQHLPSKFKMYVQGILLCQPNANVPLTEIAKMSSQGLTILPAPCNSRAELFPYIAQKNKLSQRFNNKTRHPTEPSPIELLMSRNSLRERLVPHEYGLEQGLCISYLLSDQDEFATLVIKNNRCVFLIDEAGDTHTEEIRSDIEANGLGDKFSVEKLPKSE